MYFDQGDYQKPHTNTAVWEWRDLKSNAFADELNTAFQQQPVCLRSIYDNYPQFTWFVDPACGVTPKLPDRNDLQVDVHLKAACQIIAQALCDHALGLIRAYVDRLPDSVTEVKGLNRYIGIEDVRRVMGETGIRVLVRVMGLLLVALAMQYFVNGLTDLGVIARQ